MKTKIIIFFLVVLNTASLLFSQSFNYSGPSSATIAFGDNVTGATYYFSYSNVSNLTIPLLSVTLDGNIIGYDRCTVPPEGFLPSSFVVGNLTEGNHTIVFTLSSLDPSTLDCYNPLPNWQQTQFTISVNYKIKAQNNFTGGQIYVDDPNVSKTSPYERVTSNGNNIFLGAIEQFDGTYDRIWNASGINNSNWEIKRGNNVSSLSNSQSFTYTAQSGDKNAIVTANLRKVTNITFQNNFIGVGNGGVIKVNGTQVSSPTASYSVVELNPITATAISQSLNNITYSFSNWSTGSTNSAETFYPTTNSTITSNFVGIAAQSVNLNFEASNPNLPITLNWTEYPNDNVTQYKIWRRVKYKNEPTGNPVLLATLLRGTTSYVDYDFSGTNLGFTDWMLWYDVRSYYVTEGTYPNPNWAQVFSGGPLMEIVKDKTEKLSVVKENSLDNYPNPFNPSTIIRYQIVKAGHVTLKVYDTLGREVANLVDKQQLSGKYSVNFNASSLSSGIYLYRITANGFMAVKKMILLR